MIKFSIYLKFLLTFVIVFAIVVMAIIILITNTSRIGFRNALDDSVEKEVELFRTIINQYMLTGDAARVLPFLQGVQDQLGERDLLQIYRSDGIAAFSDYDTVDSVNSAQSDIEFPRTARQTALFHESVPFQKAVETGLVQVENNKETQQLEYFFPITGTADCRFCHGTGSDVRGVIQYHVPFERVTEHVNRATLLLLIFLFTVVFFLVLLLFFLLRFIVIKPLHILIGAAQNVALDDLETTVELTGSDELGLLANKFNTMINSFKTTLRSSLENNTNIVTRRENWKYLTTVDEGILFISPSRKISTYFSASLKNLFKTEDIAGKMFSEFLYPGESQDSKIRMELEEFVDVVFEPTTSEELINSLNPLTKAEIFINTEAGKQRLVFSCSFYRIMKDTTIMNVMVRFTEDAYISDALQQLEALEEAEEADVAEEELNDTPESLPTILKFRNKVEDMAVDLSSELQKMVKISFRGNIKHLPGLQQIQESLFQLVRNAFEHGIESPQEREKNGKNRVGRIELMFSKKDGKYKIIVADDGQGIDFSVIEQQARKLNLVEGETSRDSLVKMLFSPKFSTKKTPGFGSGLDKVQQNIRALGGKISVYTQPAKKTHFTIVIPETTYNN